MLVFFFVVVQCSFLDTHHCCCYQRQMFILLILPVFSPYPPQYTLGEGGLGHSRLVTYPTLGMMGSCPMDAAAE